MNPFDPIRAYLAPYAFAIKCLLAAALFAFVWWQHHRIGALKQDLTLTRAAVQGYAAAQKTNLDTIADLKHRLQVTIDSIKADQDAARAAADQADAHAAAVEKELEHTRGELKNVYAHSATARAWGHDGVDADVAARLPVGANY